MSEPFQRALMKLSNQELPPKSAKAVLDNLRFVRDASEKYHKSRIAYMESIALKDENGKPKIDNDENFVLPPEKSEEINIEVKKMMDQDLKLNKISMDDLGDARLTAQEFSLLEELFKS